MLTTGWRSDGRVTLPIPEGVMERDLEGAMCTASCPTHVGMRCSGGWTLELDS